MPPRAFRQLRFLPPPGATELIVIRHGESEAAFEGRDVPMADGHGDPPLAAEGEREARCVGERLAHEGITAIYVSSLQRTAQTAAPLAARLGIEPIVERDLREVHLGAWEGGGLRQKVADGDPLVTTMYEAQRWDAIPGAESSEALAAHVRAAIERIAAAHPDERVAVFAHGGVIGMMLSLATGSQPFAFIAADNGSISRLVVTAERWTVRCYNDTTHLRTDLTVQAAPVV